MIEPGYFDFAGILVFALLLYIGISIRKKERVFSVLLIIIGALGLVVDGYNVYNIIANFLR